MDWKSTESHIAKFLNGERVPITGRAGKPDVEHPIWGIEVKARTTMPKWIVELLGKLKEKNCIIFKYNTKKSTVKLLKDLDKKLKSQEVYERTNIPSWLVHGLDQALLCSKNTDKIPVTILHQKNWRYSESICIIPLEK